MEGRLGSKSRDPGDQPFGFLSNVQAVISLLVGGFIPSEKYESQLG